MEADLHEEFKLWSFLVLCQSQSRMQGGKTEESNMKFKRTEIAGYIWITSWSPFYIYYISFWSSEIQESNASNGVLIGAEMKKLWPFEDNCTKLSEKFAAAKSAYENFARCFTTAKPPASTRVPLHNSNSIFAPCESPCKINLFLWNEHFQLAKSACVISDICNQLS